VLVGGASAVALGALLLSACSNGSPTTASSGATTTAAGGGAGSSTTSTTAGRPQNLVATAAVKSALTTAFIAHNGLPVSEVSGTAPKSVFYGFVPSTNTYWAVAGFVPASNASYNTEVAMQDEGCCGIFTMTSGGSWRWAASYLGAPCPRQVPAALAQLWNLSSPGDFSSGTTTTTS
jgi:hypothetical protein